MSRKSKYYLACVGIVAGILLASTGINNMITAGLSGADVVTLKGVGLLAAGVLLGIIACFVYYFLKNRPDDSLDQQKIAVETLAKLAQSEPPKSDNKPH